MPRLVLQLLSSWLVPTLLWWFRAMIPTHAHVVVHGFPSTEGNVVETVRALLNTYQGRVIWLDAPGEAHRQELGLHSHRLRAVSKISVAGVWAWASAQAVFFTHGLYGSPRVVRRKPTINLWHGEGMKYNAVMFPDRGVGGRPADYLVGSTSVYASLYARASDLDNDGVLMSGLPRIDALHRGCSDRQLTELGVDPSRPFAVWMPTFRQTSGGPRTGPWSDVADTAADERLAETFEAVAGPLREAQIQLVLKPHPSDVVARLVASAVVLDDDDLERAGVSLYEVLGRAAGLVTDVSSVATDFLSLDRPIGYFFPDREDYVRTRGVWPADAMEHLAGPVLQDEGDVRAFAAEVSGERTDSAVKRKEASAWLGLVSDSGAAQRLLDMIAERSSSAFADALRSSRRAPISTQSR